MGQANANRDCRDCRENLRLALTKSLQLTLLDTKRASEWLDLDVFIIFLFACFCMENRLMRFVLYLPRAHRIDRDKLGRRGVRGNRPRWEDVSSLGHSARDTSLIFHRSWENRIDNVPHPGCGTWPACRVELKHEIHIRLPPFRDARKTE